MRPLLYSIPFLILAACGNESAPQAKAAPEAPVPVSVASAARVSLPSRYEATGTVRARISAVVSAKLMGYAKEVRAQVGDRVTEGQPLVVLDSRDLDTGVSRAESAREEVKSAMPEADAAIAGAKAQVDLAQLTFNRMKDLFDKRSITPQELDEASARLKSAQAGLDMARARRAQLNSKLAQTEQEVRAAGIQRGYAVVPAPFTGVILTKSIETGALAIPGAPLFTMERDGGFRLEASVEESRLSTIRPGQTVGVTIDGIDKEIRARVSEIVPAIDSASRIGIVKIDLPALPGLRTGLFGRAAFDSGSRDALAIPHAAVIERGQLQSVFVADGNVARLRVVSLGARSGDMVEVLSGLSDGERVAVSGTARLHDGSPIEVRP